MHGHDEESLRSLVTALPERCGVAVLAVADRVPDLAEKLRATSKVPVTAAVDGERIAPNRVYVIPPDHDVRVQGGHLHLSPTNTPGPRLDRLLRSVTAEYGRDAIGVALRGTALDGVVGLKLVKEVGGLAFAEDVPADAPDHPRAVIEAGAVDAVAPPAAIGELLARIGAEAEASPFDDEERRSAEGSDTLGEILALLRSHHGHDFSAYKRATLFRRVARRMLVCRTSSIADYHRHLRDQPREIDRLLRDFLITVTSFFRDPEVFQRLSDEVIAALVRGRSPTEPIRVWVAGCATGEEAYSIGMLLLEQASRARVPPPIHIFATDIDEHSLAEARAGRYPATIAEDVSPERLERFFVQEEATTYRVSAQLRETIVFAPHDLLRDPPFPRLDLVSCRNLLIYLNRDAQVRALSAFHFGLRPDAHLLLGSSESAESSPLFAPREARARIFTRRAVASEPVPVGVLPVAPRPPAPPPVAATTPLAVRGPSPGEMHCRLVERYAPPSILLGADLDVVHVSEHAGAYLEVPGGEPTRQLLRLLHPALRLDVHAAILWARQSGRGTDARRVTFEREGTQRSVTVRVRRIALPELGPDALLLYFEDGDPPSEAASAATEADMRMASVVEQLEHDLRHTREQLRATIDQYDASLEELEASNEELQAINEELRSASEELQSSKEDLQSTNEELSTLNHELRKRVVEASRAHSDLQNLVASTDVAVVFLDRDLNLQRFTRGALDVFNLIPADVGRPLAHVTHKLAPETDLSELAREVLRELRPLERTVATREGHRYVVRVRPYRSLEDRVEGTVLTFIDLDGRLRNDAPLPG